MASSYLPGIGGASAQSFTILHSFGDGSVKHDGSEPAASLVLGSDGNFYGTTSAGGSADQGTVFKMTPSGAVTILHSFGDGTVADDGFCPDAPLTQASDGNFYGTTVYGGSAHYGTVFRITASGQLNILHSFYDGTVPNDGATPSAVVEGPEGNFYGTTLSGGTAEYGTAFVITPSGTETILHSFGDGSVPDDGHYPSAPLTLGRDGNFYGTTSGGGSASSGTAFEITPTGTETVLHSFGDGGEPIEPNTGLIQGADGNFYGTTFNSASFQFGTVFEMDTLGNVTTLHTFYTGAAPNDGRYPEASLLQALDGNFYGSTEYGGSPNLGTIFEVARTKAYTIVHSFGDGSVADDGAYPCAALVAGPDGYLYGTTTAGGAAGVGTVFRLPGPPLAAAGLSAEPGCNTVALSWSASPNATSYDIYRGLAHGGEAVSPVAGHIVGTSYTDAGLTSGTTYYYTIASVNNVGTSGPSNEASATPSSPPTIVLFEDFDTSTAGAWQNAYGADGFDVLDDADTNNPSWPAYASVTVSHASNAIWKSPQSRANAAYLLQTTAPGSSLGMLGVDYTTTSTGNDPKEPPTGMTYDVDIVDGNTHELAMYAYDEGAVGRSETVSVIDESPTSATYGQIVDQESFTAGNYPDGGYLVWTIGGHVLFSVTKDAGPNAVVNGVFFGGSSPSVVSSPPVLQSAAAGNNQVSLSWSLPSLSVSGYWIYRGTSPGGESVTPINTAAVTGTTFTDTGLTNGTAYYYTVAAQNTVGTSAMSNEMSATPYLPVPAAPSMTATAGMNQVVPAWSQVTYATRYDLYRTVGNGAPGSEVMIKSGATSPYTDTTVSADKTYYYEVYAVDASGSSAASNEVETEPVGASVTFDGTDTSTEGSWSGVYGKDGFNVINDVEPIIDPPGDHVGTLNPTYPSYLTGLGTSGKAAFTWAGPAVGTGEWLETAGYNGTTDTNRIAGVWYSSAATGFTVSFTFKPGSGPHPVEFYLLDWNGTGRSESITVTDAAGVVLNTQQVGFPKVTESGTGTGIWYRYSFDGNVKVTFAKTGSSPNSVLSGICFN